MACTCTAQPWAAASRSAAWVDGSACAARQRSTAPAHRQVAVDQVVRAGLVGHQVGAQPALGAAHQFGQDLGRVAQQADGDGLLFLRVALDARQRVVQVGGLLVDVAAAQAEVDAALLALDGQAAGAGEGGRQRLRAAHAAQPGGQDPAAGQAAAVVLHAGLDEGLVGALHDALAADVDPAAGGHLAVHHQALAVELVEVLPGGPLGHQVGVGDQHPRCIFVRAEHAHRLAALHQQRLVGPQRLQAGQDRLEAVPVARRLADAAVDHQRVGVLGHLGVEVVLDHAVGGLDQPVGARDLAAAGGAHGAAGPGCGWRTGRSWQLQERQAGRAMGSHPTCLDKPMQVGLNPWLPARSRTRRPPTHASSST